MTELSPTERRLLDMLEIRQLTARYNDAWDDVDPEAWAGTFTEDGVLDVQDGNRAQGHDELKAMVRRSGYGIVHMTTDPVIEIDGDVARQRCRVLTARRARDPKLVTFSATGRYSDELVRTPDGWRFRRRHVVMDGVVPRDPR